MPALHATHGREHLELRPRECSTVLQRRADLAARALQDIELPVRCLLGDQDRGGLAQQASPDDVSNPRNPTVAAEPDIEGHPIAAERIVGGRRSVRQLQPAARTRPPCRRDDRVVVELVQGRSPTSRSA